MKTRILTMLLALVLCASPARAVEVRQTENPEPVSFDSFMLRAYAPCTAPNEVTNFGIPACTPPVTSPCQFYLGHLSITKEFETHRINASVGIRPGGPPQCQTGRYSLDLRIRTSADKPAACPSGHCTYQDQLLNIPFGFSGTELSDEKLKLHLPVESTDQDVQILGATILDPDGLPVASAPIANGAPSMNLTLPYAACDTPGPAGACDTAPLASPCDFESGELTLDEPYSPFGRANARLVLRDVAGSSPLCATGVYTVDAGVRITASTCTGGALCTLVDQGVSFPFLADGKTVDGLATKGFGAYGTDATVELLDAHVVDPTGATVAVPGASEARSLQQPDVTIKGDRIQIRTIIPRPFLAEALDPTEGHGVTVSVTDRNGVVYEVTIPPERWQIQPPIGVRWDYKDPGGVLNGVRKARVKTALKGGVFLGYELRLEARGIVFSAAPPSGVTVYLTMGGLPSGDFQAQQHRTCKRSATKLRCR